MAEKRIPLRKKFPGKHVTRSTIWFPSGASIGFEGWLEKEVAELFIACMVNPRNLTPKMIADMKRITAILTESSRREPMKGE